jgi:ribonuclease R
MTDAAVLAHISRLPHARANFKQLVRELGAKGPSRIDLQQALERLESHGDLVELRSGHFVATAESRDFAAGRLNMHRDGYGFLIADRPVEGAKGDVYIPASSASLAMHGDRVLVKIARIEADGKADGQIVKVLERRHLTVVGEFRVTRRGNFVAPQDERIRQWIEIPEGMEIPPAIQPVDRVGVAPIAISDVTAMDGLIVNVELLEFPQGDEGAVGRVIEILGSLDDFGVDVEIVIRKHHLPLRFPPEVLDQAAKTAEEIAPRDLEGRRDFRDMEVITIDGETARDFDDAVWVDRLPNRNFALHVHIADVSHYVRPMSAIDNEARLRGTSVYFPDRAIPMLPVELSTNICSLKPQVDRLVLSALLEFDHQGDLIAQEFGRGVIRSAERMTYTNVHLLLEGDPKLRERYASLVPRFELMQELALILNRKRVRRGSIDFDLPEPLIEFDDVGAMIGVSRSPRNIANRIIEEFMLSANEAVAARLETAGIPSIYRIHELPDPGRVLEFEETARQFGYSLGVVPVKKFAYADKRRDGHKTRKEIDLPDASFTIASRDYQKLIAKLEGKPEERALSYLMLRSLKQARYSVDNAGHFALAAKTYTHFTSPIRRYPDLIVHRLLKAVLDGKTGLAEPELRRLAEESSLSERRAAEAERELVEWKKVKFMMDRVGDEFGALVISATRFGLFVELDELFIEGLIPIDSLPGDRYTYRENVRQIVGVHSSRLFSIGDRLRVCLDRIDPAERKLQFSVVEPQQRKKKRR